MQNTTPALPQFAFTNPYIEGSITVPTYRPWLDETDHNEVFFASVHGYGRGRGFSFYPGSGPTDDNRNPAGEELLPTEEHAVWDEEGIIEDPMTVAQARQESSATGALPWVVDVGMEGKGKKSERGAAWRRVWRGKTLPAIAAFKPDLIIISAGFDAHAKDDIQGPVNLGVKEADYEWLTEELCKIANTHSQGRVISVLEGGYRIQGGVVSAFGRSVAAHLRVMFRENHEQWDPEAAKKEQELDLRQRRLQKEARLAAALEAVRAREAAALQLASEAAAVAGEGGEEAVAAAAVAAAAVTDAGPSKRRRTAVDYSALNAQLEKESNGNANADAPMDGADVAGDVEEEHEEDEDADEEEGVDTDEEGEEADEDEEEDDDAGVLEMDE